MQCPRCDSELSLRMGVHSIEIYKVEDDGSLLCIGSGILDTDTEQFVCYSGHEFDAEFNETMNRWIFA